MPIVPSRAGRIQELLRDLDREPAAVRDSGVAQLTLLGPRAVEPILLALRAASPRFRLAALEVLDRLRDPRALPEVLALAASDHLEVALRALAAAEAYPEPRTARALAKAMATEPLTRRLGAARSLVRLHGAGVVEAMDPLLDVLLDEDEDETLRLEILDQLAGLENGESRRGWSPVLERLASSSDGTLAARASRLLHPARRRSQADGRLRELLDRIAEPALRADGGESLAAAVARLGAADVEAIHQALDRAHAPVAVRTLAEALDEIGTTASIPVLQRALERLGYEGETSRPEEETWTRAHAKAQVHATLAGLESAIALFDLRHMLSARPPVGLPLLLRAASTIGNGSLAPVLARLAAELPEHEEACAEAFAAIARRERLRRTSAALRAVRAQDRPALEAFWVRTKPPRKARS